MARLTKRQKQIIELVGDQPNFSPSQAVELVKQASLAKFDETVEVAFCLGINPKHADQQVRSTVSLPEGTGQTVRVVVAAKGPAIKAAMEAGAVDAGADELIEKIQGGWFDFDVLIATADMMAPLSKLGKILGPKKLMPNPKAGTVVAPSPDAVSKAVTEFKGGKVEFRNDRQGNVHVAIGKSSFESIRLMRNLSAVYNAIMKVKPSAAKGQYIKTFALSSTMGPGLHVDLGRLNELASVE
ncbi:50S ribosomal protein L1 [bacterium (Candidatus Blackallbacteria) CG17_big_fil_post_rev_8_21_14_2_50_48_46]|uniref:Large ribosomal subunit protein uL1 n=1 Tax=bacterium (Candidatus Blackallbacteria) CG17_big_fil_post_rev_8_21_14_2_50_48_46 TaxID=2014261 RepID=A0A2M7G2U0_9BACT|nr:MAG: 50S ribosomal protein L1 [bacterium (Candidatus Blackallbacteria) CG18_big_fil_WC_8_21_14_2_50_49_26]PIW16120.1 MAG: 50S ribosomal protein L1 [bacterium (Candidatus Blackallbacteria) CG17_big_fil_post_rev_8_21_14_2_50_48_46]PIW45769.1 MAG: 50S ribosomal protein L1 [bacterium (Candidatus Blackallbacteria) CG13_big_fil_rev_8_21_14_2_50_49_14]